MVRVGQWKCGKNRRVRAGREKRMKSIPRARVLRLLDNLVMLFTMPAIAQLLLHEAVVQGRELVCTENSPVLVHIEGEEARQVILETRDEVMLWQRHLTHKERRRKRRRTCERKMSSDASSRICSASLPPRSSFRYARHSHCCCDTYTQPARSRM